MDSFFSKVSHHVLSVVDDYDFPTPYATLWQGKWWSPLLYRSGLISSESFRLMSETDTVSIMSVCEIRSIGMRMMGAFVVGGPLVRGDTSDEAMTGLMSAHLSAIQKTAKERGVIFVSIETLEDDIAQILSVCGLVSTHGQVKKFVEPYTRCIDVTQTKDDILMQMTEKGRYNVRYASKKGVRIDRYKFDETRVDEWYDLLSETALRDGFSLNPRSFFERLAGVDADVMHFLAYSPSDKVIAQAIFIGYGVTGYYYYGASSSDPTDRKLQSTYLLQYEMMCYAKDQGYTSYDLLGIAPPQAKKHHLSGVSEFKAKLGGKIITYPSARLMIISRVHMYVYVLARRFKSLLSLSNK